MVVQSSRIIHCNCENTVVAKKDSYRAGYFPLRPNIVSCVFNPSVKASIIHCVNWKATEDVVLTTHTRAVKQKKTLQKKPSHQVKHPETFFFFFLVYKCVSETERRIKENYSPTRREHNGKENKSVHVVRTVDANN